MLFIPFPFEKVDNGLSAGEEPLTIPPDAVLCVGLANEFWVAVGSASDSDTELASQREPPTAYSKYLGPFSPSDELFLL